MVRRKVALLRCGRTRQTKVFGNNRPVKCAIYFHKQLYIMQRDLFRALDSLARHVVLGRALHAYSDTAHTKRRSLFSNRVYLVYFLSALNKTKGINLDLLV